MTVLQYWWLALRVHGRDVTETRGDWACLSAQGTIYLEAMQAGDNVAQQYQHCLLETESLTRNCVPAANSHYVAGACHQPYFRASSRSHAGDGMTAHYWLACTPNTPKVSTELSPLPGSPASD